MTALVTKNDITPWTDAPPFSLKYYQQVISNKSGDQHYHLTKIKKQRKLKAFKSDPQIHHKKVISSQRCLPRNPSNFEDLYDDPHRFFHVQGERMTGINKANNSITINQKKLSERIVGDRFYRSKNNLPPLIIRKSSEKKHFLFDDEKQQSLIFKNINQFYFNRRKIKMQLPKISLTAKI